MSGAAPPAPDDAALVARCLSDDEDAWNLLVARHGPLAWAVIRRTGLSPDDASDVYQTTWLAALEQLPRLRDRSRFPAWIARTAHLQALRMRRGYGISRRVLARIPLREADDRVPEDEITALEDRSRVTAALREIGARCAALLAALYYEQPAPAYRDISARLSMPIGSIGPTRARCLERLALRLGLEADERAGGTTLPRVAPPREPATAGPSIEDASRPARPAGAADRGGREEGR